MRLIQADLNLKVCNFMKADKPKSLRPVRARLAQLIVANSESGFTLTEIVVASAIMALVFMAVLSSISLARRINSFTENRLNAMHMARSILEEIAHGSYEDASYAPGRSQLPDNRGYIEITQSDVEKVRDVTVVINWVEPHGAEHSITLTTSHSRSLHR